MHIIARAGAGIVRIAQRVLQKPHGCLLQFAERLIKRRDIGRHRGIAAVLLDVGRDFVEKRLQGTAAVLRQFAADEIERLNAVGALIQHRDACVAHELLHAVFSDVTVAAIDLLRRHRIGETLIGEHAFDDRRHQAEMIVGLLPFLGVPGTLRDIGLERSP